MSNDFLVSLVGMFLYKIFRKITNARMQAVMPVPHEVMTGFSNETPARKTVLLSKFGSHKTNGSTV